MKVADFAEIDQYLIFILKNSQKALRGNEWQDEKTKKAGQCLPSFRNNKLKNSLLLDLLANTSSLAGELT